MLRVISIVILFTFSYSSFACEKIKMAHKKLLESNFSVNRNFALNMDDESQLKLKNIIKYNNGYLSRSNEEVLFIAKDFKHEEDNIEQFFISDFICDNVKIEGEKVTIDFLYDDKHFISHFLYQNENLTPIKTIVEGEASFLFMSFNIKSVANYSNFKLLP